MANCGCCGMDIGHIDNPCPHCLPNFHAVTGYAAASPQGAALPSRDETEQLRRQLADMTADYLRRHKDACDRYDEIIELKAQIAALHSRQSAPKVAVPLESAAARVPTDREVALIEAITIVRQARESIGAGSYAEQRNHEWQAVAPYLDGIEDALVTLAHEANFDAQCAANENGIRQLQDDAQRLLLDASPTAAQPSRDENPRVPNGVYYLFGSDDFYDSNTRKGMGTDFYIKWRDFRTYFPQSAPQTQGLVHVDEKHDSVYLAGSPSDGTAPRLDDWISVADRLPELSKRRCSPVLLVTDGYDIAQRFYCSDESGSIDKGWVNPHQGGYLLDHVTHWMPRPPIPKEPK